MKSVNLAVVLLASVLITTQCDSRKESPLVIFLTPTQSIIESNTNEHVIIKVEAFANVSDLSQLKIQLEEQHSGVTTLVDSSLANRTLNYTFDFIVPEYPDSTQALLTFTIFDGTGNQISAAKILEINKGSSLITESSGHIIYSRLSGNTDAFTLSTLLPGFSTDLFDVDIDFMDNSIDSVNGSELSRTWISRNGLTFVKYNGFNYAMANSLMITEAFDAGIMLSKATNINDGDVFLIGRNNSAIGAVQVVTVVDNDSTMNDKYLFNLKIADSYFQKVD